MMEGQLIFCSDSILRFRSNYDETTALPLLSIQKTISDTDPFFLLRFFRHTVMIEEGTTLAEMEAIFISGLFFQTPRAAASCFDELKIVSMDWETRCRRRLNLISLTVEMENH